MSKRKVLTFDDLVKNLELSKHKSARKIADEMGVGKTQIQPILKRKSNVLEDVQNNVSGDRKSINQTFLFTVFKCLFIRTVHVCSSTKSAEIGCQVHVIG